MKIIEFINYTLIKSKIYFILINFKTLKINYYKLKKIILNIWIILKNQKNGCSYDITVNKIIKYPSNPDLKKDKAWLTYNSTINSKFIT